MLFLLLSCERINGGWSAASRRVALSSAHRPTLSAYKATMSDMTSLSMWNESATRARDPTA